MTEDNGASPMATGLSSLRDEAADASSPKASIPRAAEFLMTDRGLMSRSQYVGLAMARALKERGIWRKGDEADVVLNRLRDMAALSKAAIAALEDWDAQAMRRVAAQPKARARS